MNRIEKIKKLYSVPGNSICADCNAEKPESYIQNYNILVCRKCAGVHRSMTSIRVRDLNLDNVPDNDVEDIYNNGNIKSNQEYLKFLPIFYQTPNKNGPEILRRTFILAKYLHKQFAIKDADRPYIVNNKHGALKKRSKDKNKFNIRFFRLSIPDISFNYFIKEGDGEPKGNIRLDRINATFIVNPESKAKIPDELLMISYFRQDEGSWRHIYLNSNTPDELVNWYQTIRFAKYSLRAAYVVGAGEDTNELELAKGLTFDITMSGWMFKTGPMLTEQWQKRWCVLLGRRLLYSTEELSPSGKGEIVIGERASGYSASLTAPEQARPVPIEHTPLTIVTPGREYFFAIPSQSDLAEKWHKVINDLADTELSFREMADYQLHPRLQR